MKRLLALLLLISTPVWAQSTASQTVPGTLSIVSGQAKWAPISSTNQLPIAVYDAGNHATYVYTSNGSGSPATFQPASGGGGSPGGSSTDVQFNNAGVFGGDSGFTYGSGAAAIGKSLAVGTTGPGTLAGVITGAYNGLSQNGLILTDTATGGSTWGFGDDAGAGCVVGVMCFMNVSNNAITYTDTSGNERILGGLAIGSLASAPPTNGLSVVGAATIGSTLTVNGVATSGTVHSGTQYQLGYYAATGTAVSGDAKIYTDSQGNLYAPNAVGFSIGTSTTPTYSLNIHSSTANMIFEQSSSSSAMWFTGVSFAGTTITNWARFNDITNGSLNVASYGDIGFTVGNAAPSVSTGSELYIRSTGVSIGTTTPAGKLNVAGAIDINAANALSYPTSDTTAGASIAIGASALSGQTSSAAYGNTAVGYQAMGTGAITTGATLNTVVGQFAGKSITSGNANTLIGENAGQAMTTSGGNVAIGQDAMVYANGATAGSNLAVGASSLYNCTTCYNNVGVGNGTLSWNSGFTGSYNSAIGPGSVGSHITSGSSNTLIGNAVASSVLTTGSNNILIGTSSTTTTAGAADTNEIAIGGVGLGSNTTEIGLSGTTTATTIYGSVTAGTTINTAGYTVAALPTGVAGARAYVTDSTSCSLNGALTGGGTIPCPVWFNGTSWLGD